MTRRPRGDTIDERALLGSSRIRLGQFIDAATAAPFAVDQTLDEYLSGDSFWLEVEHPEKVRI